MALTRRGDGTGSANRVYAAWWNDFYDLLTGAMSDQPVTIANQATVNKLQVQNQTWLNPQTAYGSSFPTITLGLGDNDTGFNWEGDGHLTLRVNGSVWGDWQAGKGMQFVALDSGTPRLVRIYIGTSAPVSPGEGDIWIKA